MLGLTPGARFQVKELRRLVEMKLNAKPEVHGLMRTQGLSKGFEIEELRYHVNEEQQCSVAYSGHMRSTIESIGLPEEPSGYSYCNFKILFIFFCLFS